MDTKKVQDVVNLYSPLRAKEEDPSAIDFLVPPNAYMGVADADLIDATDQVQPLGMIGDSPEAQALWETSDDEINAQAALDAGLVPGADPETEAPVTVETPAPADPMANMVDRKVGSTSTSTSTTEMSDASRQALSDIQAAQGAYAAAAEDEKKAVAEQGKAEALLAERKARADAAIYEAQAQARQEVIQGVQLDLDEIANKEADLINQKSETFWGSKSESDKITAALSVGLGSFAQALTGSGQNVGMVMLQRNMSEFDARQKQQFEARKAQIAGMRANIDTKRQLMNDAEKVYDAQRLAATARIEGELGTAARMAKTATVQAAIGQKQAQFAQQGAQMRAQLAQKYETTRTTQASEDVYKKVTKIPGMTRDGKPMNVEQAKALGFYSRMKDAQENVRLLGAETELVKDGAISKYFRNLEKIEAYKAIPFAGPIMNAAMYEGGFTPEDTLRRAGRDQYNYINQARNFTAAVLRRESGAAISPKEFVEQYRIYYPQPGDGPREIEQKAKLRDQAVKDMLSSTGI